MSIYEQYKHDYVLEKVHLHLDVIIEATCRLKNHGVCIDLIKSIIKRLPGECDESKEYLAVIAKSNLPDNIKRSMKNHAKTVYCICPTGVLERIMASTCPDHDGLLFAQKTAVAAGKHNVSQDKEDPSPTIGDMESQMGEARTSELKFRFIH